MELNGVRENIEEGNMISHIIRSSANGMSILAVVLLAVATSAIYSQTQKKVPATRTPVSPSTCETALKQLQGEVEELRRQLSLQKTGRTQPSLEKGSLEIEAGLVFQNRAVKPVVREAFYLLKDDPATFILTKENYELAKREAAKEEFTKKIIASKFEEWNLKQATLYNQLFPEYRGVILRLLKDKAAVMSETGFDGRTHIEGVETGNYYLFGVYHYAEASFDYGIYLPNAVIWNLPVTIKSGTNKIILDNKNTI
jgi:hypothetical protein